MQPDSRQADSRFETLRSDDVSYRPGRDRFVLVGLAGPATGMEYTLEQNTVTIGRSAECDVCISDDLASRRHVQLSIVPDPVQPARSFVHVQDLQSRNGIRINGATIGSTLLDGGRRSSSAAPCSVSIAATTSTSRTSPACAPSA